jgi:hypothetical protein
MRDVTVSPGLDARVHPVYRLEVRSSDVPPDSGRFGQLVTARTDQQLSVRAQAEDRGAAIGPV